MIEAVVFDMDGVLIDSEKTWEAARKSVVVECGLPYPPPGKDAQAVARAVMGKSAPEWARYMRKDLGVDLPEPEIIERVLRRVAASWREDLRLIPGAAECVRAFAECWPLALASSSNRPLIELALELAKLKDCFRVVISSEEVPRGKPAPDVYLRAAELLDVAAQRCAAIEDSANGIRSAKTAGLRVVCIPNRDFPPAQDALALADVVLPSIVKLTPEIVASLDLRSD